MIMIDNEIFEIHLELLINKDLYKKNIIDKESYEIVNEKLLSKLKNYKQL